MADVVVLGQVGRDPVDPTGGGDSCVAALTTAVLGGAAPADAAWAASAAVTGTVRRLGGRPAPSPECLAQVVRAHRR
ncbi:hypothetical protein [Geodermatophilus marinus]|uniref:hypothetical protein n=1 Tax=Geodermatophilus sp. LHW52908 TaxID=2303986 RepID=UPI000E3D0375|nr:hypothetical protein [Geodermatophilus sp. LHW52908]RFU23398.1 hypothetical protein D0Z06_01815 [Geodermatophilus sp. LHW52908]